MVHLPPITQTQNNFSKCTLNLLLVFIRLRLLLLHFMWDNFNKQEASSDHEFSRSQHLPLPHIFCTSTDQGKQRAAVHTLQKTNCTSFGIFFAVRMFQSQGFLTTSQYISELNISFTFDILLLLLPQNYPSSQNTSNLKNNKWPSLKQNIF